MDGNDISGVDKISIHCMNSTGGNILITSPIDMGSSNFCAETIVIDTIFAKTGATVSVLANLVANDVQTPTVGVNTITSLGGINTEILVQKDFNMDCNDLREVETIFTDNIDSKSGGAITVHKDLDLGANSIIVVNITTPKVNTDCISVDVASEITFTDPIIMSNMDIMDVNNIFMIGFGPVFPATDVVVGGHLDMQTTFDVIDARDVQVTSLSSTPGGTILVNDDIDMNTNNIGNVTAITSTTITAIDINVDTISPNVGTEVVYTASIDMAGFSLTEVDQISGNGGNPIEIISVLDLQGNDITMVNSLETDILNSFLAAMITVNDDIIMNSSNIDMDSNNIDNVNNLTVANLFGVSPINVNDDFDMNTNDITDVGTLFTSNIGDVGGEVDFLSNVNMNANDIIGINVLGVTTLNATTVSTSNLESPGATININDNIDMNTNNILDIGTLFTSNIGDVGGEVDLLAKINMGGFSISDVGTLSVSNIDDVGGEVDFLSNINMNSNDIENGFEIQAENLTSLDTPEPATVLGEGKIFKEAGDVNLYYKSDASATKWTLNTSTGGPFTTYLFGTFGGSITPVIAPSPIFTVVTPLLPAGTYLFAYEYTAFNILGGTASLAVSIPLIPPLLDLQTIVFIPSVLGSTINIGRFAEIIVPAPMIITIIVEVAFLLGVTTYDSRAFYLYNTS